MTINVPANVLIWAVPVLLFGFVIGTGILRKFSRTFWLFIIGWLSGLITLVAIVLTFPIETAAVLGWYAIKRGINSIFDNQPTGIFTINVSQQVGILVLVIVALLVIVFVIDWEPKKRNKP